MRGSHRLFFFSSSSSQSFLLLHRIGSLSLFTDERQTTTSRKTLLHSFTHSPPPPPPADTTTNERSATPLHFFLSLSLSLSLSLLSSAFYRSKSLTSSKIMMLEAKGVVPRPKLKLIGVNGRRRVSARKCLCLCSSSSSSSALSSFLCSNAKVSTTGTIAMGETRKRETRGRSRQSMKNSLVVATATPPTEAHSFGGGGGSNGGGGKKLGGNDDESGQDPERNKSKCSPSLSLSLLNNALPEAAFQNIVSHLNILLLLFLLLDNHK